MEDHNCIHEREWGEVLPMLQKISKEVYGNGEVGLIKTVPRLEEKINNLVSAQTAHTKVISDLLTFQAALIGEKNGTKDATEKKLIADELKSQKKRDRWQRIIWIIMAVIALGSLWFTFYSTNNKMDANKVEINHRVDMQKGIPNITRGGYILFNNNGLTDSAKILNIPIPKAK